MIIQGTTDATGVIKPFQDNVTTVAGLHVGDTIGAMWYRYGNNGYSQFFRSRTFSEDDCMSAMVVLAVVPGQAPPAPQKFFVDGESLSFPLAAQIEPGATIGDVVVRVRAGDELDGAPIVRVSIDREDDPRDVAMEFDAATGEWVGDVHGLPDQCFVNAEVQGADADGRKANIISQATLTGAVDDEDSEIASADGAVRLSIPEGAFAEPTQIVIGGSIAPLPDDFPGQIVVGPIGVTTNGAEPALAAVLSFPLRFDSEAALLEQLDPTMLIVLAFDETTGLWNEIDATYHSGKLAVDAQVAKFGAFVLLDRGAVPASGQQGDDSSPADASGTPDNRAPDSPVAPAADCGTGVFGSSMAMASPLMLVLAGVRRRRCRNVIA
ncbi:MAG: hypothetical protein H6820_09650 [Phycisphaerales bacterium]|nr:hypothetical protein [Phycisphaerales bacterium]